MTQGATSEIESDFSAAVERDFRERLGALQSWTDSVFSLLLIAQFAFGIVLALTVSPRTWIGSASQTHIHVWTAVVMGGLLTAFPLLLIRYRPGEQVTRYVVAIAQMLFSGLLIHLTGGRIETHFHVFGSLAFLAFYRDARVLLLATAVVLVDHLVRGIFWPQSVYGVISATEWRTAEHGAWVLFEVGFLLLAVRNSRQEIRRISEQRVELSEAHRSTERLV